jgi:hypothetical protein
MTFGYLWTLLGRMCGTIDSGSCIRWVHGFGIKIEYDTRSPAVEIGGAHLSVPPPPLFPSPCSTAIGTAYSHCPLHLAAPDRTPPPFLWPPRPNEAAKNSTLPFPFLCETNNARVPRCPPGSSLKPFCPFPMLKHFPSCWNSRKCHHHPFLLSESRRRGPLPLYLWFSLVLSLPRHRTSSLLGWTHHCLSPHLSSVLQPQRLAPCHDQSPLVLSMKTEWSSDHRRTTDVHATVLPWARTLRGDHS